MRDVRIALIGATGLVGRTTLDIFTEWDIPVRSLRLFASDQSAGGTMRFRGRDIPLEKLDAVPADIDAAIFATSKSVSRQWVPAFREAGVLVIDHSAEFRMDADVPLVIPEVNGHTIAGHSGLIANPNCSASVVILPLAALDRAFRLKTVIVDTYQSVSGSGQDAVAELENQIRDAASAARVYPRPIGFNVFPQVGPFDGDGQCDEERKMVEELRKMLDHAELAVFTTTVRVPVRVGHSVAATVECERAATKAEIEEVLRAMPGMIYEADDYRTPLEIAGKQEVFVSRLRQDRQNPRWLQLWAVGDNLRKGAASNAIQILMELYRD